MQKYFLFFFLFNYTSIISQQFSVLTCDKGDAIYSTFGHSAIRYIDSNSGRDWVYNYGLFDFGDPQFVPKFCDGKLDYMVGKETFEEFIEQYKYQNRTVKEQKLSLSMGQRDSLFVFLEWNILPENRFYRYDFLYNNCATRIIDVIENNCKGVQSKFYQSESPMTFRQAIHKYARNTVPYIDWGMDLALGTSVDKKMSPREYCFLPDYVAKSIAATSNPTMKSSLGWQEDVLVQGQERPSEIGWAKKPVFLAITLLFIGLYYKFYKNPWSRVVVGVIFIILGVGGLVIGYEWFFTEHTVTKNNWNLGWLNPLSIVYGVLLIIDKHIKWVRSTVSFGAFLALLAWIFGWQEFYNASKVMILFVFFVSGFQLVVSGIGGKMVKG